MPAEERATAPVLRSQGIHVPHMCPAAAPNAGAERDHAEREGTGKAHGSATMKGNGASCFE
jgi:hypothetical protein